MEGIFHGSAVGNEEGCVTRGPSRKPCREGIVAGNAGIAHRHASRLENTMMAAPAIPTGVLARDQLAHDGLLTGWLNGVDRRAHAQPAKQLVTPTAFNVCNESK